MSATDTVYRLEHAARPWSVNKRMHHMATARLTAEWRQAFKILALQAKVPHFTAVRIKVIPAAANGRWRQDVGACFPAAKAAIDGLVDAGVLDDDTPDQVVELTFVPVRRRGVDALVIEIREAVA